MNMFTICTNVDIHRSKIVFCKSFTTVIIFTLSLHITNMFDVFFEISLVINVEK